MFSVIGGWYVECLLFHGRVCRVFDRVKSRSAHMKSHRQMEPTVNRRPPFAAYNNVAR